MRISSQRVRDALLQALADEYSRSIMVSTIKEAKSVQDLSRDGNIPMSTAYRRVNEMTETGLLTVERIVLTEDGKKYELYRSAFKSLQIGLDQGDIAIDVALNDDVAGRLTRLWAQMRG